MDRGAWQATVHRVAKSRIRLKQLSIHAHMHSQKSLVDQIRGDKEEKGLPTPQVPLSQQSPGLHPGQNIATVLSTWPILTSVSPPVK